jgi:uncharacterized damage-inducible protein DinB
MAMIDAILAEFEQECQATRRLLECVPEDQFDWQPHEKSMSLGALASHIAENPTWAKGTLETEVMNMDEMGYTPYAAASSAELLDTFDKAVALAVEAMTGQSDENLAVIWSMVMGGQTVMEMPRIAVLRSMILNHMIHHRGQLTVYLRLKNVALPSVYGPTADEPGPMG